MTPDEIVLLARKADLWITSDERWAAVVRFARLVEAAERSACAQVCAEIAHDYDGNPAGTGADNCVEAIRRRGNP